MVIVAGLAVDTVTTVGETFRCDKIANRKVGDSFAHFGHNAACFVSLRLSWRLGPMTKIGVQVAATDTSLAHRHHQIAWWWRLPFYIVNGNLFYP